MLLLWDWLGSPRLNGVIGIDSDQSLPVLTISYVVPGMPAARAGLRRGDKIDFTPGSLAQQLAIRRWYVGHRYVIAVQRITRHFQLTVVPVVFPRDPDYWLNLVFNAWVIGFTIILAVRGTGRRAILLAWLLLMWAVGGTAGLLGVTVFITRWPWLDEIAYLLSGPANGVAVALLATISSTFAQPIGALRRGLEAAAYVAAAIYAAIGIWEEVAALMFWPAPNVSSLIAFYAALLLAAACAICALIAVRGEERQRATWLLIPLAASFLLVGLNSVGETFFGGWNSGARVPLGVATAIAQFVLPVMLTYAVLRRRLLDVDFVLNRAAVFAGVSLVVIGVFVLTEWLLNKFFFESRSMSLIVSLFVALALGVSLQFIHRYVDRFVDRVFFRTRHEHERLLRAFAHEAAYITDYDTLLDNTVREVSINVETDRVSILIPDGDGTYDTVRGTDGAYDRVTGSDRAVVKMRAWHTPVDLEDVDTVLNGSWAYPLMCRGDLVGILVCGAKRDGQGYAPDESEALATLAQGVGSALGTLRPVRDGVKDDLKAEIGEMKATMQAMCEALRVLVGASLQDAQRIHERADGESQI